MMNIVIWILAALIGLYIFFIVIPSFISVPFIFSPKVGRELKKENFKGSYYDDWLDLLFEDLDYLQALKGEEVRISSADGVELFGNYYDNASDKLVIMFHGFGVTPALNYALPARLFNEAGWNMLLVDQRGHGRSGDRTYMGAKEKLDVPVWVDWAKKRGAEKIVIYGSSMGGATVLMASDLFKGGEAVRAIVSDSAYNSINEQFREEMKKRHQPTLMLPYVRMAAKIFYGINLREDAAKALKKAEIPVIFMHGERDRKVPCTNLPELFEACASEKYKISCEEADHICTLATGAPKTGRQLLEILDRLI